MNMRRAMSSSRRYSICLLGLLIPFSASYPQGVSGLLEGRVTDTTGAALSDVEVIATGPKLPGSSVVHTNELGRFRLLAIPAGSYVLRFRLLGYRPARTDSVGVSLDRTTVLPAVRLESHPMVLDEMVVLNARSTIDPYTATIGGALAAEDFEKLPLERDYSNAVTLLPLASASVYGEGPNIAGSTGIENAYYVDGVNVTDPYRALGSTTLPYDFIDHVELKAGGYEAEYGRSTGGIINVITRSGSDELRGSAFGFFTDNSLAADSRLGLVELGTGAFRRYDVGAALGGPIVRHHAWFFTAYNPSVEQQDMTFPGVGVRPDRKISHQLAAKVTVRPSAGPTITGTLVGDPSTWDRIGHNSPFAPSPPLSTTNPDPFLGHWKEGGVHGVVRLDWPVTQQVLVEGEVARSDVRLVADPVTERGRTEPLFEDLTTGIWSGGYGNTFDHRTSRTATALATTVFLGAHVLKAGFQYENNFLDETWQWLSGGPDSAGLIIRFAPAGPNSVITFPLDFRTSVRNRVASLFLQGSVAIFPRLRLNPGIRWQGEYHNGVNSGLHVSIGDEWQPRIGLTYLVARNGSRKLSASYGRYYEEIPLVPISFYVGPLLQDFVLYDHDPRADPTGGLRVSTFTEALPGFHGEHFDEFTVAYEHQLVHGLKVELQGLYRDLRAMVQDAIDPSLPTRFVMGNPGRGFLSFLPKPVRRYAAGTITIQQFGTRLGFLASYTLSRNYGNYPGLYTSDVGLGFAVPNTGLMFDDPAQVVNATGLLPNDRTHVFKLFGSYEFPGHIALGTSVLAESGTPLNEFGGNPINPTAFTFLQPRGSAGRTSATWDWNVRLSYDVGHALRSHFSAKTILDLFHIFSPRRAVLLDQQHFFAVDASGQQSGENPNYRQPLLYQPPMTARLGMVVDF